MSARISPRRVRTPIAQPIALQSGASKQESKPASNNKKSKNTRSPVSDAPGAKRPKIDSEAASRKSAQVNDQDDEDAQPGENEAEYDAQSITERMNQFGRWSTEALFVWGTAYDQWPLQQSQRDDRKAILHELASREYDVPKSAQELQSNWKSLQGDSDGTVEPKWEHRVYKRPAPKKKERPAAVRKPLRVEDSDSETSNVDEDEELSDDAIFSTPKKKKKLIIGLSTSKNEETNIRSSTKNQVGPFTHCPHCGTTLKIERIHCEHCGLNCAKAFNDPQNQYLRELRQATQLSLVHAQQHSGQANKTDTANAPASKQTLSRHEQEYERLAIEGREFARFGKNQSCTVQEAFAQMTNTYMASEYEMQPQQSLIKLIQSGKLKYPAWALPKPIMEEEITKSGDTVIKVGSDGKITTSQQLKPMPLNNLEQFVEVFATSIMPALIEQPRALMDWAALLRSVVQLHSRFSWHTAHKFLSQTLASKINAREPFGNFDINILSNVLATTTVHRNTSTTTKNQTSARSSSDTTNPRRGETSSSNSSICNKFNWSECTRGLDCKYQHKCLFIDKCKNSSPSHRGKDCEYNPRRSTLTPGGLKQEGHLSVLK